MARRFLTRIGAICANRGEPAIRNLKPPEARFAKGVQFGKPETIRENLAIRANLRIDSHESGHLSFAQPRESFKVIFNLAGYS